VVSKQKTERFMELEGLRGIAAVIVAFYHNLLAFYAFAFFGAGTAWVTFSNTHLEQDIHGNPLMAFVSGTFAVAIFFVLSGFVLSIGFFQTGKESIVKKMAAKRYLRLMLPALGSVLICYLLMKAGLGHAVEASLQTHSGWLASNWNFAPHFLGAIGSAVWDIFLITLNPALGGNLYNNVLWTMLIEFPGSFLVFGSLLLFGKSDRRWILYIILTIITLNSWFLGFVIGMVLADLTASGILVRKARSAWTIATLLVVAVFLGGYPISGTNGTIYRYLTINHMVDTVSFISIYTLIGATILIMLAISSTQIARLLATKYISRLGKYTFSLYLVHLPILFTYTTFAFIHLRDHFGYNTSALLAMVSSVPVVAVATYVFERYVDTPSIRLSSYLAAVYLEGRELPVGMQRAYKTARRKAMRFVNKLKWKPKQDALSEELAE
jgi:peptidoglycan/LPS O-acetylase OafA/YrhL